MALLDLARAPSRSASFADWIARISGGAAALFVRWDDARRTRNALLDLSDHELDDIGLTRGDVDTVSRYHRF